MQNQPTPTITGSRVADGRAKRPKGAPSQPSLRVAPCRSWALGAFPQRLPQGPSGQLGVMATS
jgi:hypothetical protein